MAGFDFVKKEPLGKGMSSDKKFYTETADGQRFLLRVADISEYDRKKAEYERTRRVAALGIPMSEPVDFGICEDGKSVVTLLTWVDGDEAEAVLPTLPDTEQYVLGVKSGEILRKIHTLPAPEGADDWAARYFAVIDGRLDAFRAEGVPFDGDTRILEYLKTNRDLLKNRPQCLHHGDYHAGNMILTKDGGLSVIDWHTVDFDNYGDPWYEFNRIGCDFPAFASGQIDGYFHGKPPQEFWRLLAYYLAASAVTSVVWAKYFAPERLDAILQLNADVLRWFDNMKNPVPAWYWKDFHLQHIGGVPYRLRSPFDFSFIGKYGTVFKVFDDQDSGNICFGVRKGDNKYFVKFAGAPTAQYHGTTQDAVDRLKAAVPVYTDLSHPHLIKFVKAEEIGGGLALVFEWANTECMGRMYPGSRQKFMRMPLETKLKVFDDILSFHAYVAKRGYVAVDFYDGSILYDFEHGKTKICDIDFYAKMPYTNRMGRMWGSSRFLSPEERTVGAEIDEITNVYTMGATAFALFSEDDRTPEKWPMREGLYEVAKKAVSEERGNRFQSIDALMAAWKEAGK